MSDTRTKLKQNSVAGQTWVAPCDDVKGSDGKTCEASHPVYCIVMPKDSNNDCVKSKLTNYFLATFKSHHSLQCSITEGLPVRASPPYRTLCVTVSKNVLLVATNILGLNRCRTANSCDFLNDFGKAVLKECPTSAEKTEIVRRYLFSFQFGDDAPYACLKGLSILDVLIHSGAVTQMFPLHDRQRLQLMISNLSCYRNMFELAVWIPYNFVVNLLTLSFFDPNPDCFTRLIPYFGQSTVYHLGLHYFLASSLALPASAAILLFFVKSNVFSTIITGVLPSLSWSGDTNILLHLETSSKLLYTFTCLVWSLIFTFMLKRWWQLLNSSDAHYSTGLTRAGPQGGEVANRQTCRSAQDWNWAFNSCDARMASFRVVKGIKRNCNKNEILEFTGHREFAPIFYEHGRHWAHGREVPYWNIFDAFLKRVLLGIFLVLFFLGLYCLISGCPYWIISLFDLSPFSTYYHSIISQMNFTHFKKFHHPIWNVSFLPQLSSIPFIHINPYTLIALLLVLSVQLIISRKSILALKGYTDRQTSTKTNPTLNAFLRLSKISDFPLHEATSLDFLYCVFLWCFPVVAFFLLLRCASVCKSSTLSGQFDVSHVIANFFSSTYEQSDTKLLYCFVTTKWIVWPAIKDYLYNNPRLTLSEDYYYALNAKSRNQPSPDKGDAKFRVMVEEEMNLSQFQAVENFPGICLQLGLLAFFSFNSYLLPLLLSLANFIQFHRQCITLVHSKREVPSGGALIPQSIPAQYFIKDKPISDPFVPPNCCSQLLWSFPMKGLTLVASLFSALKLGFELNFSFLGVIAIEHLAFALRACFKFCFKIDDESNSRLYTSHASSQRTLFGSENNPSSWSANDAQQVSCALSTPQNCIDESLLYEAIDQFLDSKIASTTCDIYPSISEATTVDITPQHSSYDNSSHQSHEPLPSLSLPLAPLHTHSNHYNQLATKFIGQWVVDKSCSDLLEPMAKAMGIPYLMRLAMDKISLNSEIELHENSIIRITTRLPFDCKKHIFLYLDGSENVREDSFVGVWRCRTSVNNGGLSTINVKVDGSMEVHEHRMVTSSATDDYTNYVNDVYWYRAVMRKPNCKDITLNRCLKRLLDSKASVFRAATTEPSDNCPPTYDISQCNLSSDTISHNTHYNPTLDNTLAINMTQKTDFPLNTSLNTSLNTLLNTSLNTSLNTTLNTSLEPAAGQLGNVTHCDKLEVVKLPFASRLDASLDRVMQLSSEPLSHGWKSVFNSDVQIHRKDIPNEPVIGRATIRVAPHVTLDMLVDYLWSSGCEPDNDPHLARHEIWRTWPAENSRLVYESFNGRFGVFGRAFLFLSKKREIAGSRRVVMGGTNFREGTDPQGQIEIPVELFEDASAVRDIVQPDLSCVTGNLWVAGYDLVEQDDGSVQMTFVNQVDLNATSIPTWISDRVKLDNLKVVERLAKSAQLRFKTD